MANAKLSKAQEAALEKLSETEWKSAYDVDCSLATLNALVTKGYARSKHTVGSMAFPRNSILFKKV